MNDEKDFTTEKFGTNEDLSGVATGSVIINTFTMVITSLASGVMV